MILSEGLLQLWHSTGIYNMVDKFDPSITNPIEQFLHQFGHPIMLVICLFLLWQRHSRFKQVNGLQESIKYGIMYI